MKNKKYAVAVAVLAMSTLANGQMFEAGQNYVSFDASRAWSQNAGIANDGTGDDGVMLDGGTLNELGMGTGIGLALGTKINENVRAEIALNRRSGFDITGKDNGTVNGFPTDFHGEVKSLSIMANAYYSMNLGQFSPYVGAGIGVAKNTVSGLSYENTMWSGKAPGGSETGLAWQMMVGVDYPVTEKVTLSLGYKYADLGEIKTSKGMNSTTVGDYHIGGVSGDLKIQEINVGIRFSF